MGRPYSYDLRVRFVALLDVGMSASAAARRMTIARSTAVRWAAIWRQEQRACALPMGGDRRSGELDAHAGRIRTWLDETPDLFLREIQARLAALDVPASTSSIDRLLARHGITLKKRRSSRRNRLATTSPGPEPTG